MGGLLGDDGDDGKNGDENGDEEGEGGRDFLGGLLLLGIVGKEKVNEDGWREWGGNLGGDDDSLWEASLGE